MHTDSLPEIRRLTGLLVEKFNPVQVILFGSQAEGTATAKSDIDLCVIADVEPDVRSRREFRSNIHSYLIWECKSEHPLDVLVYTPAQWNDRKDNKADFASMINEGGVILYG
jgi:predicted nucleotidyltransferase